MIAMNNGAVNHDIFIIVVLSIDILLMSSTEYRFVSYNRQKRIFTIENEGLNLLDIIEDEKRYEKKSINEIIITF